MVWRGPIESWKYKTSINNKLGVKNVVSGVQLCVRVSRGSKPKMRCKGISVMSSSKNTRYRGMSEKQAYMWQKYVEFNGRVRLKYVGFNNGRVKLRERGKVLAFR